MAKPWPPEIRTPERAIMELMDAAFWAKQQGFENVAQRLEWATDTVREILFPQLTK
jgi:hypothetical protein